MSKRKIRSTAKKRRTGTVTGLPAPQTPPSQQGPDRKLSEIIKEMALQLLRSPDSIPTRATMDTGLLLATAAWNSALGYTIPLDSLREQLAKIDWDGARPWAELLTDDTEQLLKRLVAFKRERYPTDLRRVVATEMSQDGRLRVHWTEPETVAAAPVRAVRRTAMPGKSSHNRPIADRLVKNLAHSAREKVIGLSAFVAGKQNAEDLQRTVATREELARFHPAHALYIYAQNQVSVMAEQLLALEEMSRFNELLVWAEDEYMPSGPPISPLTTSFFSCWAFFDVCMGAAEETIGTTVMTVGSAFGMHEELVRLIGLMQHSRMAVYAHEGVDEGQRVVLRELVTNKVCSAISPSGYLGHRGELWYARVLPPPAPGLEEHIVFTTPYLLLEPGEYEWLAYFKRVLPDAPAEDRLAAYRHHMKYGPTRDYWPELVFEGYVNHTSEVIVLKGLPDVPESRPHSGVNSR